MFKFAVKISLIIISLCFSIAFAQNPNLGELRSLLARLDIELGKARELIRSFDNPAAQVLLAEAENLRNQAADILAKSDPRPADLLEARRHLQTARLKLEQAVKLTLEGTIRRWRSRLEQLLQRAEQEVIGSNHQEAERLLQLAKQNRNAADRELSNRAVQKALEHLRVAINLTEQALELATRKLDILHEEDRRFETLRERARELVEKSSNTRAAVIFNQAEKMAESALQAFRNGNHQLSRKFYNQALLLLLRAMDVAKGQSTETVDDVNLALYRLRESIDNLKNTLSPNAPARVQLIIERAQRLATEAELAAQQGRSHEALWKIELAENLVRRAQRLANDRGGGRLANRIAEEIENTRQDIADVRGDLSLESSPDAEILVNMAELALTKGEQAATAGADRFALEAVLVAQRLLTKAERILNKQDVTGFSKDRVEARLAQLDEAMAESESRIDLAKDEWARRLLLSAKEFRGLAAESLQKGNYHAADEGVQVAFDLLRKSLKSVPNN